jgi:hypothetical protein
MAQGLGLLGAGLKTKEQAFQALGKSAQEETRNKALQEQIDAQKKAAEIGQASTLTAAGAGIGAFAKVGGAAGGVPGALIGAAAGFLLSKIL